MLLAWQRLCADEIVLAQSHKLAWQVCKQLHMVTCSSAEGCATTDLRDNWPCFTCHAGMKVHVKARGRSMDNDG